MTEGNLTARLARHGKAGLVDRITAQAPATGFGSHE